jgi:hypothetical protein|tara:strand:+ start:69 stop:329 length:261 start_codon:yes stop_codon:yes gene_type:complete
MIKEIKYLIFIIIISSFLFFTIRYYFSDNNEKRNYRSLNQINQKLNNYAKKLPILENDTQNIIQYVEQNNTKKKKYKFWKLLEPND